MSDHYHHHTAAYPASSSSSDDDNHPIFHGDILEVILSHVPLIDLIPSCQLVSTSFHLAISSSLSHLNNPIKPWLLFHSFNPLSSSSSAAAFDPRSRSFLHIIKNVNNPIPTSTTVAPLNFCSSDMQFSLTPTKLSYSADPLRLSWSHLPPPHVWRVDPLVALVGDHVVVAGGGSEYEDDPLAVEVFIDGKWVTAQSMPVVLKNSAAPTWLSVAATKDRMVVTEKATGITYAFSPESGTWAGPFDLRPDPRVCFSTIGFDGRDLILAGLIGPAHEVKGLKLWRLIVDGDTVEVRGPPIGEVPMEMVDKLKGEMMEEAGMGMAMAISVAAADGFVYVYNTEAPAVVVYGEMMERGKIDGWESVVNVVWKEKKVMERVVVGVGKVGVRDLQRAVWGGGCRFEGIIM